MFILKKQRLLINHYSFFRLIAICTVFFLVTISSNAISPDEYLYHDDEFGIIIETDQDYYTPGDTVYVTGQLLRNGQGHAGGFCPKVLDPENNFYWNPGICYPSNPDGTFEFNFDIYQGSMHGIYTISIHGYIGIWEGIENIIIVVSEGVTAEANGPYEGTVNVPIDFYGNATGGMLPYSWHWDFGDNTTADTQNATHNYTEPGQYTATLTATDNDSHQGNDTAIVNVNDSDNQPPTSLGPPYGPGEGDVGVTYTFCIEFTDPEEDNIYVMWDWGDGTYSEWLGPFNSGEEVCASHFWTAGGDYELRVKAKDEHGAESNWSDPLLFHVKAPILEVEISDGLGLTLRIRNVGDGDAHNVTWYFSTQGGILGLINIEEEGLISTLPAGGEESIVLTKLLFGLGSIEITIEVSADYVNTETATISAFIIGPFIIIV
jgi:hypothetical protein